MLFHSNSGYLNVLQCYIMCKLSFLLKYVLSSPDCHIKGMSWYTLLYMYVCIYIYTHTHTALTMWSSKSCQWLYCVTETTSFWLLCCVVFSSEHMSASVVHYRQEVMKSVLMDSSDRDNMIWGYRLAQSNGLSTVCFIIFSLTWWQK